MNHHYSATDPWLLEFLGRIQDRPAMFLGGNGSVEALALFIHAYGQAREDLGVRRFSPAEAGLLDEFETWMKRRLNHTGTLGWSNLIEQMDRSPRNADTFFKAFSEFLHTKGLTLPSCEQSRWPPSGLWPPRVVR